MNDVAKYESEIIQKLEKFFGVKFGSGPYDDFFCFHGTKLIDGSTAELLGTLDGFDVYSNKKNRLEPAD